MKHIYIFIDLSSLGDRSWKQKSNKNRSENGVSLRRPLGIDFCKDLIDVRLQVGTENRSKTGHKTLQRGHRKQDRFSMRFSNALECENVVI